jgi:hypothetical protein
MEFSVWTGSASMLVVRRYAFTVVLAAAFLNAASVAAQSNVLFIFDASGSMKTAVGNDTRIGIAKKAMEGALKEMPPDTRLGLMMYLPFDVEDLKITFLGEDWAGQPVDGLTRGLAGTLAHPAAQSSPGKVLGKNSIEV